MTTAASRYDRTEPLLPDWAPPVYLGASIVVAIAFGLLDQISHGNGLLAILKTAGIVLLAFYAAFRRAPLLALALLISSAGDFFLAIVTQDNTAPLGWGIAAFAAAHLVYLAIFARLIVRDGIRREGLILAAVLLAYGAAMAWWLAPQTGALTGPVLGYIAIITLMAIAAALANAPRIVLFGALLFIVSDSLLAGSLFRELSFVAGLNWVALGIWASYYAAQLCLTLGIARTVRRVPALDPDQAA